MNKKEQMQKIKTLVNSYKITEIIVTAKNIGIFNVLNLKPKNVNEISKELNLDSRKIEPILNALTMYEIISKKDNTYFLDKYNDVLNIESEFNQLGYIDFAQTIMAKWAKLENSIRNKNISEKNFKELTESEAENFMKGMDANAIVQAKYVADNYEFTNHKILDIGAGAGTYLITVANQYESVTGKMIDLPEMVKIQNKRIEKENLQNRITSVYCDYNIDFPKEEYDDIFLFAVVHQESEKNINKLFSNIYKILKPNGKLFLTTFFLNDDKISPEFSVQFAIEMLLNTEKGKAYTHNEIQSLLKNNNFNKIERDDDIPSPATLYVITK